jgi:hypothetical protein
MKSKKSESNFLKKLADKNVGIAEIVAMVKDDPSLLDAKNDKGNVAIHYAVHSNNFDKIKYICGERVDITSTDAAGIKTTVSERITQSENFDINACSDLGNNAFYYQAIIREQPSMLATKFLLDQGLKADVVDNKGDTPLHKALAKRKDGLATILICNMDNYDAKNDNGVTALHIASYFGDVESVELLCRKGANPDMVDNEGYKPIDNAVRRGIAEYGPRSIDPSVQENVVNILVSYGAIKGPRFKEITGQRPSEYNIGVFSSSLDSIPEDEMEQPDKVTSDLESKDVFSGLGNITTIPEDEESSQSSNEEEFQQSSLPLINAVSAGSKKVSAKKMKSETVKLPSIG